MNNMKIGRLILAYREDSIPILRDFYLGGAPQLYSRDTTAPHASSGGTLRSASSFAAYSAEVVSATKAGKATEDALLRSPSRAKEGKKTEFLVIAYNRVTVDPNKFDQSENFKLVPYYGIGEKYGQPGGIGGQQYHVWVDIAKKFPGIDGWVIHDYDFIAKPTDKDIFSRIAPDEYAMLGTAFPVWQPGMGTTDVDTYPFPQSHRYWHQNLNPDEVLIHKILMESFPVSFRGIPTVMGGANDFIATSKENILLLDNPKINDPNLEGAEQVPHTVWRARGVRPVDMRKFYKMKVVFDVQYIPFSDKYDMLNPVKYWPGQKPSSKIRLQNLKYRFKKFIKQLIGYKGFRFGR